MLGQSVLRDLAIYVHWPFCQAKCPYCDFNSFARDGAALGAMDEGDWREAYRRELEHYARLLPYRRVSSVFFGGGTPSLMEVETVGHVLETIARLWGIGSDVEVTLEANPGSAEAGKFAGFRAAGVDRLSLGVQSLREEDLRFLGRVHSVKEALQAIDLARQIFPRFSFDLIYARRGQTLAAWELELREALALAGDHLSLYQLTIELNTVFHTRVRRGEVLTAEEIPSVEMYELTQGMMTEAGLPPYEISNHARAGQESRHNLTYWRYGDYVGIGPGAHGRYVGEDSNIWDARLRGHDGVLGKFVPKYSRPTRLGGCPIGSWENHEAKSNHRVAIDNHRAPEIWMRQAREQGQGARLVQPLDLDMAMREALMMGLRLARGIDLARWRGMFGMPLGEYLPAGKRARLAQEGYWREDDKAMGLTSAGLQRLNAILGYLLA
ncbi:MAG: radical SAM family heme chaperone HemW [Bdellovibrionales bacterium]